MDTGASNYRRFLEGDDDVLVHLIEPYKDGLILQANYVEHGVLSMKSFLKSLICTAIRN